MKGIVKGLSALALATAVFAAPVQAQGSMVGVSGAGIFSLEDEGGSDFGAGASFEWSGANGFGVRLDGNYIFDPEPFIIDANVMYTFMTSDASMVHPYILAGGTLFGIDSFVAVINPPHAAILAVGAVAQKPIVRDGQLSVGQMMSVTLSGDHRAIDGALGAQYLKELKALLEHPMRLLF